MLNTLPQYFGRLKYTYDSDVFGTNLQAPTYKHQPASCKLPAPQGGVDTNALQALQVELLELSDLFPSAVPSWIS